MTRDEWVTLSLVLTFASLLTAHVTIVVGLLARPPRWRAPVAAVVFPLAPYWANRTGMHARSVVWLASALAYVASRWLAYR
jgi:hypothetical protein